MLLQVLLLTPYLAIFSSVALALTIVGVIVTQRRAPKADGFGAVERRPLHPRVTRSAAPGAPAHRPETRTLYTLSNRRLGPA